MRSHFQIVNQNHYAQRIQKAYSQYRSFFQKEIELKKICLQAMQQLHEIIVDCPTASRVNGKEKGSIEKLDIIRNSDSNPLSIYKALIDQKIGSCGELSSLLYVLLSHEPMIDLSQLHICQLESESDRYDHAFIVMGNLSAPQECLVLDPWIKYLDLNKNETRPCFVAAEERERGFMGSGKDYFDFLSHHPNVYISFEVQKRNVFFKNTDLEIRKGSLLSKKIYQKMQQKLETIDI